MEDNYTEVLEFIGDVMGIDLPPDVVIVIINNKDHHMMIGPALIDATVYGGEGASGNANITPEKYGMQARLMEVMPLKPWAFRAGYSADTKTLAIETLSDAVCMMAAYNWMKANGEGEG